MIQATAPKRLTRRIGHAALLLTATCLATVTVAQSAFDDQRESLSLAVSTQPEQAIHTMLKAGLEENKPTQALALTERWLRDNSVEDPSLLYHAGKAAELSGDWDAAVALYRQYLKRADLKSDTASDAILGSYTLQINHLAAPEAAYAYAKVDGHKLVGNAQARQFDRWFLNEAKKRGDKEAVASRLLALAQAKVDKDLLIALHEGDFHWLLGRINDGRLDQARYGQRFIDTVKALAKQTQFDKELSLLLDWSVSVKAYNMAMLDGEQVDPPIAEAQALLSSYPRHAERVQTGWAGGGRGQHYRGDTKKYWPIEQAAKLAPVNTAVAKLSPVDQARFYQSYGSSYYSGKPQLVPADQASAWVQSNPKLSNSKAGPVLQFNWSSIKLEDAKKLAPLLAQNPSPEAAGIRAIAAVNDEAKELDKSVDALLKSEAWRLNPNELPSYIDRLWHRAGRPDGNARRDQLIQRGKQAAASIKALAKEFKAQPANQRLATFRSLWNDYKSNQPKQIGVRPRLVQALYLTPEALPELIRDPSVQARMLLHEVMNSGRLKSTDPAWAAFNSARAIYTDRYAPCFNEQARRHYGGMNHFIRNKDQYRPHPLGPTFHKLLEDQLKQNKVETWVVFAWLNTQFPEDNAKSVELMQRLTQSPAWKTLSFEARAGARLWFRDEALSPAQRAYSESADVDTICAPLLTLPEDADTAAQTVALKQTLDNLKRSPVRHEIKGLEKIGGKDKRENALKDAQLLEQVLVLAGPMRSFQSDHHLGAWLLSLVAEQKDPAVLHDAAAFLWRHTEVHHRTLQDIISLADKLASEHPSAGHTLARIGLQTIARHTRGHTYYNRDTDIPRLKAIRGKAAVEMNLISIPVPPNHPAYPIYQSQSEFLIGNVGTARQLYEANADQLLAIHRQLSIPYLLWSLQGAIDGRNEALQEDLVKALLAWSQDTPGAFSVEQRIALDIAYGDIALQRGMLPEAQRIFATARGKEAYAASFDRHNASLRLVRVQRIAKDFDAALQTLMELDSEKVPRLTTEAHFARAEVYYDMEEYQDSADEIAEVLARDPEHSDAKILEGRVHLKRQKLIEATEVELGSTTEQPSLVPGQMLKVTLNDPTLSVSSGASDIEVEVWSTSGDKEYLLLRQFGDQKTKYRGDVRTALGKPVPDDGVLQVVGDDEVYYAYSERFRAKMVNLEANRGGPIQVASDAMLMASARKLLSENEQRVADMQRLSSMLTGNNSNVDRRTNPERYAALKADAEQRNRQEMLQTRVKPGNPIYLRVLDPDRGRTAEIDELPVSVTTSSGDVVARVVLKETETHSGRFEGRLTTTAAQAMAFATSSETGRNPNMVISPKTDYPAWRPIDSNGSTHSLTIDLNDNVDLGQLVVDAKEEGAKLKAFKVQAGMNASSMQTVAVYPKNPIAIAKPWHPSVVVMNDTDFHHGRNDRSVYDLAELRAHMDHGWVTQQFGAGAAGNVAGPSEAFTPEIPGKVKWLRQGRHHNAHVVYRFRGYFYEPVEVTRRFKVELGKIKMPEVHSSVAHPAQYLVAVNGRAITSKEKPNQLEGEVNLRPGVHSFEIWATGWDGRIGFGRSVKVSANLNDADQLVDCPDSFFDPGTFPEGVLDHRNAPATITATEASDSFTVDFASESRGRLIRLVFLDQEGPVPAVNRIALKASNGEQVLPVQEDFAQLRKNDVLEILTGDKVAVRYLDDRFVTKSKQRHERFLNVAFTDAKVEFADIDERMQRNAMRPYHEELIRFAYGIAQPVVIYDADMDETTEPDQVTVLVSNGKGETRELTATETGPSTGTFRAWITPTDKPTQAADQIQVAEGGTLTATYLDKENVRPGVPYERFASIKHGAFSKPQIEIAHATLKPYVPTPERGDLESSLNEDQAPPLWAANRDKEHAQRGLIKTRYEAVLDYRGMDEAPEGGLSVVHGRQARVQIVAPHLALGNAASVQVYVQTDTGRKMAGRGNGAGFDINVPGTMVYTASLVGGVDDRGTRERGGYLSSFVEQRGNEYQRLERNRELGQFQLSVPLITGLTMKYSYADREAFYERSRDTGEAYPYGLVAKAGERIHIGVKYKDAAGKTQWSTASAKVIAAPMMDVMREDYRETLSEAYVGEKLFVRVVDPYEDRTAGRDKLRVYMQTKSGQKHYATLTETNFNSGIFKGVFQLTYADAAENVGEEGYDVGRLGMPVQYGDAVGVRYTDAQGRKTPAQLIAVAKGSDGAIAPFSKQYDDAETAMQTQFAMAESFLELARRHRKLGEEDAATREFTRARQLLANTVAQFTDPETRAHAEYLLGNLTVEDAEATEDKELQADRYQAALARYMKVTGSYEETAFAAKAQFKIAVVYERLGEPDIAAQEYVKLAYKYPDSEHLATSMARLGTHFQRKAVLYDRQAKPLLEDEENKDDFFEGTALKKLAQLEYIKSAQIFERLQERFPSHELAGTAGLRAGQIYMRAEDLSAAVKALESVFNNESYDGPTLRCEAMYWAGRCHVMKREDLLAYSLFKRITYDFPESKWAAYARSQLSSEQMLRLDQRLEIERLEAGQ